MSARMLSRRNLIAGAAAWSTIGLVRAPARAAQFTWKFALNAPVEHPNSVRVRQMCDAVRRESNGRLDIQLFPASVLGGDLALLSQLRSGAIQMYLAPGGILSGIVPAAALDSIASVVERNANSAALAQRRDIAQYNVSLEDKLRRQGMTIVKSDAAGFRAKLGPYYGRWKSSFGTTGWSLLERHAGTLA